MSLTRLDRGTREGGLVMPLVLIILALGALIAVPLLSQIRTGLARNRVETENEASYYAADAVIEAVLADLRQGLDPLSGPYTPPTVVLNGYAAIAVVELPPRDDVLPFGAVFIDPESSSSLQDLAAKTAFNYSIFNVRPGADLQINWSYAPAGGGWKLTVYEGEGVWGPQVSNASGADSPGRHTVDPKKVKGGTYTVSFYNNSNVPVSSAAFSNIGDPNRTWVRATAFKDYLITAYTDRFALSAFARQGPGPNQVQSSVYVSTWHSDGLQPDRRDDDEDGISTGIDGQFAGAAFADQSKSYSANFTDQHLGGATYGGIVDRAGLTIRVLDDEDPARGVRVVAAGPGSGTATVSLCGSNTSLTAGDVVVATCGSLTLRVLRGDVEVELPQEVRASLPTGTTITVAGPSPATLLIKTRPENAGRVTLTLKACRGTLVKMPASVSAGLSRLPDGKCQVENTSGVAETGAPEPIVVQSGATVMDVNSGGLAYVDGGAVAVPTPTATATFTATAVPADTPTPATAPSPGATPAPTPTAAASATPLPEPVATATPTPAPTPTPTPPTPTPAAAPAPTATPRPSNAWLGEPSAPSGAVNGSAMAADGWLLYVLRGGGADDFWSFDTRTGQWSALESVPDGVGAGGALAAHGGMLYALRGDRKSDFWRFDPADGAWTLLADAPAAVGDGGSLAALNGSLYAVRGDDRTDFWRFDPATGRWTVLEDVPAKAKQGTALAAHAGSLYALRGRDTDEFWRYEVSLDSWFLLGDAPARVGEGGSLVSDGRDIYALRGRNTADYWRYVVSTGSWELAASTPARIRGGGALGFASGAVYALRGGGHDELWIYIVAP